MLTVSMVAAFGLIAAATARPAHAAIVVGPAAATVQAPDLAVGHTDLLTADAQAGEAHALIQPVDYYWHHRRWPYRWNGGYYRYRWGGGYYRYRRWRGGRWSYY